MVNTAELCSQVSAFLSEEVSCFEAYEGIVGCNLPISYPDGDSVTVYVMRHGSYWEVTDHGEAYGAVLARWSPNLNDFKKVAQPICESLGVTFVEGRVSGAAKDESALIVLVWAVGRAAARIAEGVSFYRPRKRPAVSLEASESFVDEVAKELSTRDVELGRNVSVVGASGHRYTAALFVPHREAVVEPLLPTVPFPHVTNTYAKFGDLQRANGYQRYSVIDDRTGEPTSDIVRLLKQVSDVVAWTEREPWVVELMRR